MNLLHLAELGYVSFSSRTKWKIKWPSNMVLTLASFTMSRMSPIFFAILFIVVFQLWILHYCLYKFKYIGLWYIYFIDSHLASLTTQSYKPQTNVEIPPPPKCISQIMYADLENWLLEAPCEPLRSRIQLPHSLLILIYEVHNDTLYQKLFVWILMTDLFAHFLMSKTVQVNAHRLTKS